MAAVAYSRRPQTPPEAAFGTANGSWDFAVPLEQETTLHPAKQPLMSEDDPSTAPSLSSSQPLTSQTNGISKHARPPPFEGRALNYEDEQGYLGSGKDVQRKESHVNGHRNDPDGFVDSFKPENRSTARSASQGAKPGRKRGPTDASRDDPELDDSKWIHRDKLAQIESKELEEAFKVGRGSRSNSRSASATRAARDRKNSHDPASEKHRIKSPIPAEDDEVGTAQETWDLRSPEEIAAEREAYAQRQHPARPGTSRLPIAPGAPSRIPVAKTSPLPFGQTFEGSFPRSRKGSTGWSGEPTGINGVRARSGSQSSAILLDDLEYRPGTHTPPSAETNGPGSPQKKSPPKPKTPAKMTPASGNRKSSGQRNTSQTRPRNTSGQSPVKRPGTSGGSISRPTTSHRPEGEAPWIATMYKPDPRLPPDQQIIPTHAKRLQQEQWENEGKVGSAYDRDFRLLNTEEFKKKAEEEAAAAEAKAQAEQDEKQANEEWPLPSPTKRVPAPINTTIKTPPLEQGGYKLTPTVPQSPRVASRTSNRPPIEAEPTGTKTTITARIPVPPAEVKEKKGCGFCIVM